MAPRKLQEKEDILSLRTQRMKRSPVFPVLNLHHEVKQNHCGEGECEGKKGQKLPMPSLPNPNSSFFGTFNSSQYLEGCLVWDLEHAGIHVIITAVPCSSKDFLSPLEMRTGHTFPANRASKCFCSRKIRAAGSTSPPEEQPRDGIRDGYPWAGSSPGAEWLPRFCRQFESPPA